MFMGSARILQWVFLAVAAVVAASCGNPEQEKRSHLARGDQYAAAGRDEFAVVEYASAVKLDQKFGEARFKLAQTQERMGNLAAAYPEYIRAADALPDNRAAQVKATEVLLATRQFENARARVAPVLAKNPKDVDALLLQASALAGLQDPAGAVSQIEEALRINPRDSRTFLSLGAVRLQTDQLVEAEAAVRKALEVDPASIDARIALATLLMVSGRADDAEAVLKGALEKDPRHLLANRMLGALYMATQRTKEAEQPLKTAAEISKKPAARLQLADYYAGQGRAKEATDLLTALSSSQATFAEAERRLAALEYAQGDKAQAHKRIDGLLARVPANGDALTMKSDWLIREGRLEEALDAAKAAVTAAPQSAAAYFALATVQDRLGDASEAVKSFTEVTRLDPRADRAMAALSRLNLRRDREMALRQAEDARSTAPGSFSARNALARSLLAVGNLARAETEISELLKATPDAAGVHALVGSLQAAKGDFVAARNAYERALYLSPGLLEALGGLTYVDLQAKAPERAVARLEAEIVRQPTNVRLLMLTAQTHTAAGDPEKAEPTLRRVVALQPRFMPAYEQLASLYVQRGMLEQARAEFEGIARRDPSAVGAKTMVGMLLEAQGKRADARKWYEGMVNGANDAPVAANNLAFIYAEEGTNLDLALQLAQSAKQKLPDDPNINDTLGWVYYRKGLPSLAVGPLEESLKKWPNNPEALHHLGLTYAKLGAKTKAREALGRALKLDPAVGGLEVQQALASVSQ